jgi:hypothetical protein
MNLSTYPVIGGNISQTLFNKNERLVVPNDTFSNAYQNLSSVSGINALPQNNNTISSQMPAYINQAHISTWYQDNPWEVLTYSSKFGLPTMGGELDANLPPGYRPGNTLKQAPKYAYKNQYESIMKNTKDSKIMKENFGNIKINWQ